MTDSELETLQRRVRALERAQETEPQARSTTNGDADLDALEPRVDALETEVTELRAAVQAVRGYVGNVRAVNREVERRADAALAKVESFESTSSPTTREDGSGDGPPRDARTNREDGTAVRDGYEGSAETVRTDRADGGDGAEVRDERTGGEGGLATPSGSNCERPDYREFDRSASSRSGDDGTLDSDDDPRQDLLSRLRSALE